MTFIRSRSGMVAMLAVVAAGIALGGLFLAYAEGMELLLGAVSGVASGRS